MNKYISIIALLALPACMGGGDSDSSVDLTPSAPSVSMNNELGALLNDVRVGAGEGTVVYEPVVGRAAQIHANDMFDNDTLSIFLDGTTEDMGDTLRDRLGYDWSDIGQLIAQGDFTVETVLDEWETNGSQGNGGGADELTFEDYDVFGLAKAGSGDDQRWVLLLVNPS